MEKYPKALIRVRPSLLLPGEVGLFAVRNLKKGTIINKSFSCNEKLFSPNTFKRLDKETKEMVTAFTTRVYDGFFSIPDINYLPISWFGNHSCEPNMGFDRKDNIVLIKDVKSGDELTHDYGFSITDPKYILKCKCGSKTCRKVVTGNDWKNKEFLKKNKQYMCI